MRYCSIAGMARMDAEAFIAATVLFGATLLFGEASDVLGLLDLVATIPAARMGGECEGALDDARGVEIGEDDERALGAVVGHGVAVEIEADVGRLADLDLDALVGGERLVWLR